MLSKILTLQLFVHDRCGNEAGCCAESKGCLQDSNLSTLVHAYGTCKLMHAPELAQSNRSSTPAPPYVYRPSDVLKWSNRTDIDTNIFAIPICTSFVSGAYCAGCFRIHGFVAQTPDCHIDHEPSWDEQKYVLETKHSSIRQMRRTSPAS